MRMFEVLQKQTIKMYADKKKLCGDDIFIIRKRFFSPFLMHLINNIVENTETYLKYIYKHQGMYTLLII